VSPSNLIHRRIESQFELAIPAWTAFNEAISGCKVVLDIGANDGGMFNSFIPHGVTEVHAFEPVPGEYAKMISTFGNDSRLIPNNLAVSDEVETIGSCRICNAWTIIPTYIASGEIKDIPPFECRFTTVDLYCSCNQVKPDFIKVDVDGYELRVLKGALHTLTIYRPPMLFELSFLPTLIGDNCEELCKHIFKLGYVAVTMDGKTVVRDWLSLIERFPWRSSFDVMLMPKERV
jgi:FkbM family methyltransferase